MANAFQPSARDAFGRGEIDWTTDDLVVVLVDDTYTYSAAHEHLDDVAGGTRLATSDPLTGATVSGGGVLDADDVQIPTTAGDTIAGLWVAQDTGNEATSRLIVWFDRDAANQLINVDTDTAGVIVTWSNAPTRIARI